ncbi:ethanolamine ammonia-lyase subunit EutC [Rhodococcus sp. H36-A4]|uniref:ethanolamine ammonia-lyase subunit EutC n=1 Tax=unclassified Rhodococcus (in: high G+C Gram-positive bacteria) TaxID=192944 RepID=UPI0022AF4FC8|nr:MULTISPECIES: ethanolamine ammonia-lyase subunit EutC [unclassified Rhodococcus (in: high G+C Gram-positive bacteria)]MCZ4076324.1 ethanolamine ammonia-lyase subunit EutC [Rhodococcus sp. H36-A4]MDJ0360603.1 ethanolamine ammonia-lyase subunit EutC [Rhodococcus sp. H29-C3]
MTEIEPTDFWADLRLSTQARIGLGRTGDSLPTRRVLELRSAHAAARDAVHTPLEVDSFTVAVERVGLGAPAIVTSKATSRAEYLRRPDLGREPEDLSSITPGKFDIGFVLSDGLSPRALTDHGTSMLEALVEELADLYSMAPPVIATEARVALGDHIAEAMGVRTVVVLIGERPGLSVADSLGIYLTHLPAPGRSDADRNCISNIHPPEGLGYRQSAKIVAGLVRGARRLGRSGVALKDTSRADVLESSETMTLD